MTSTAFRDWSRRTEVSFSKAVVYLGGAPWGDVLLKAFMTVCGAHCY